MQKNKLLIIFPVFLFILLLLSCMYNIVKTPVEILDFQTFYTDGYHGRLAFYVNCRNVSYKKTVDSFILSVVCNSDKEKSFQYRILEPEGISPGDSRIFVVDFSKDSLPVEDITKAEISVSLVNFTNGSIWENHTVQKSVMSQVDGNKGTGMFPVRMNEALFYEESETPSNYEPIHFQINWSNISEEESIIHVIYKVRARTLDGTVISSAGGNDEAYISEFYEKPDEWIPPHGDNVEVTQMLLIEDMKKAFRENDAAIYEISVCRAVTSNGVIWENTDRNDCIAAVINGKKEYSFTSGASNPSIQNLVESISREAIRYDISLERPEVFVKNRQYCVLRYPNLDVRVELSETDEVLPDKVGFVYYSRLQYDDPEKYIQSVYDMLGSLRLCVCAAVLTEMPYSEVEQKIREYNSNDKAYVDFDNLAYDTFDEVYNILDENENVINCCVFACGKDLYYPPHKLLWAQDSPYESQQGLEVQHRQSFKS